MSRSQWNDPFLIKGCFASNQKYIITLKHKGCPTSAEPQNISIPVTHINNHTSVLHTGSYFTVLEQLLRHWQSAQSYPSVRHLQLFYAFTTACTSSLWCARCDYAVSKVCRWNNSPHCCNKNILPQPISHIFLTAADFVISQGRSVRQRFKKKKKTLCLGVFVFTQRIIFTSRARA